VRELTLEDIDATPLALAKCLLDQKGDMIRAFLHDLKEVTSLGSQHGVTVTETILPGLNDTSTVVIGGTYHTISSTGASVLELEALCGCRALFHKADNLRFGSEGCLGTIAGIRALNLSIERSSSTRSSSGLSRSIVLREHVLNVGVLSSSGNSDTLANFILDD
jgi:hypothetical protein